MTGEEAKKRREERIRRDTEKFKANLKITRPGFGGDYSSKTGAKIEAQPVLETGKERIDLSGILWISPEQLKDNPYNDYPPLTGEELKELARDIAEKGVLVPLIVRVSEDVLICGHNRKRAGIEAKEPKVPVQRVLRLLSEAEEREIMKSENDRRRGGNWTKEKKEEFIREHFGEVIHNVSHGGDRKSKNRNQGSVNLENSAGNKEGSTDQSSVNLDLDNAKVTGKNFTEVLKTENQKFSEPLKSKGDEEDKKFTELLAEQPSNLARQIQEKSKGNITEGTAKRIISGMRKEKQKEKPAAVREKEKSSLSEKDRKRGEKLALHLRTLRSTRSLLEDKLTKVKEEEKRVLKELKFIGQPELFGVES